MAMGNIRARFGDYGAVLLTLGAAAGLITALAEYFLAASPIGHTAGALLVIVTAALVLAGALIVLALAALYGSRPVWLRVVFDVLLIIGLVGTGFAAWFLEANLLLAFMVVGVVGWLWHVFGGRAPRSAEPALREGATP